MSESPKGFLLNVGGTRYEVSDSLLDRFPDSMLRKITSDIWNQSDDDSDTEENRAAAAVDHVPPQVLKVGGTCKLDQTTRSWPLHGFPISDLGT